MSYKLGQQKQVQHVESGAWIPARFENGAVVSLDDDSPFVRDLKAWVAAGNTPLPADPLPAPNNAAPAARRSRAERIEELERRMSRGAPQGELNAAILDLLKE